MKYAPFFVPLILALGVIAVTIYRPPTAPGHPANRTTSSMDCGGAMFAIAVALPLSLL